MTHSDLRMASRRWTSQKPTNIATASQFAAPSGTARPHSDVIMAPLCRASQEPPKPPTVSQFAAPRDGEASFWPAYDTTPPRSTKVATFSQFAAARDGEASF